MKFDFLFGCFSSWKTTGPHCSSATRGLGPHFTDDQAEAQAVCSPQHFCYKGPRGHPASQMIKLRLRQYVLLSTSLGLTKSSNVLLHFILHIVFTPKDVQSLKPKDCLRSTSTTAGVVERQCSSYVVIFSELPKGPI